MRRRDGGRTQAGLTEEVVRRQLDRSLPDGATAANTVIAYEPVWAIGSGLTPTSEDVARVHAAIRQALTARFAAEGAGMRILYGGSVKPSNARELLSVNDVERRACRRRQPQGHLTSWVSLAPTEPDGSPEVGITATDGRVPSVHAAQVSDDDETSSMSRGSRTVRSLLVVTVSVAGTAAVWAAKLDKIACAELSNELNAIRSTGIKADMERGPAWAMANMPPERLQSARRLLEIEDQLEFRCSMRGHRQAERQTAAPARPRAGDGQAPASAAAEQPRRAPSLGPGDKRTNAARRDVGARRPASAPQRTSTVPPAATPVTATPADCASRCRGPGCDPRRPAADRTSR